MTCNNPTCPICRPEKHLAMRRVRRELRRRVDAAYEKGIRGTMLSLIRSGGGIDLLHELGVLN